MTEVGGAFITQLSVSADAFTTVFAPSGEEIKITMVFAKNQGSSSPANSQTNVSPAIGTESNASSGASSNFGPVIGGNSSLGSSDTRGIQPVLITDSDGLFIGNTGSINDLAIEVIVQGVRIA